MLKTIYLFELKKLFFSRVIMIAMAGVIVIVVLLAVSSASQDQPASLKSAKELDGRIIDENLFDELKPALKEVNGSVILQVKEGYEKYAPLLPMIRPVSGDEFDFSRFQLDRRCSLLFLLDRMCRIQLLLRLYQCLILRFQVLVRG